MKLFRSSLLAAAMLLTALSGTAPASPVGLTVSNSTLRLANGQSLDFQQLRGQVVVLSYWMSDCKACDAQMAVLDNYYRQRRDVGLVVFAIPVETLSDRQLNGAFRGRMIHPVSSIRGPFELLQAIPTTYVVDRYGQIRYAGTDLLTTDDLNRILVPLIRQPQP